MCSSCRVPSDCPETFEEDLCEGAGSLLALSKRHCRGVVLECLMGIRERGGLHTGIAA